MCDSYYGILDSDSDSSDVFYYYNRDPDSDSFESYYYYTQLQQPRGVPDLCGNMCNSYQYSVDEETDLAGNTPCLTSCQCDGVRTCGAQGYCQGQARPYMFYYPWFYQPQQSCPCFPWQSCNQWGVCTNQPSYTTNHARGGDPQCM